MNERIPDWKTYDRNQINDLHDRLATAIADRDQARGIAVMLGRQMEALGAASCAQEREVFDWFDELWKKRDAENE